GSAGKSRGKVMEAGSQSRGNRVYFPPFVLSSGPKAQRKGNGGIMISLKILFRYFFAYLRSESVS
ncbi:hypothetical protein, partial [Pediococcus cellicola]|uniref:hypothetical protein n=1 Tax=Pediococcus cellicola TaxID=319652 RepID=UPI001C9970E7